MRRSFSQLSHDYEHLDYLPEFKTVEGKPALTGIDGSDIGEYVIMTVRDPLCGYQDDSALAVARHFDSFQEVARTGMFITYTGFYKGAHISVVSGGSGAPEAELVLNEFMMHSAATTYIRLGGSGGWHESVHPGDIVISSAAVRDEGMTASYVVPQYPAVASHEVVLALNSAATKHNVAVHVGVTRSGDSEYCGWGKPSVGGYMQRNQLDIIDYYNRAGILNTDRETSAILTLTSLFGFRGGSICSVGDNVFNKEPFAAGGGHGAALEICLDGIALLHRMDCEKQSRHQRYWTYQDEE